VARAASRWLLAFCLFGSLTLPCPASYAASPVWAVRGPRATVYLAGSVHLLKAQDAQLPAGFERAYQDSSCLVMEIDLGRIDPAQVASWIERHGSLPPGETLRTVVGDPLYARLGVAAAGLGAPQSAFDTQQPWVVSVELAELQYLRLGYDPEQGVEQQLVRRARADHKSTEGLETVNDELGGLETLSREDQLRVLDQTLDELKDAPSDMRVVVSAWRRGDAARLAAVLSKEYRGFPTLYRPLVTVRNQHWLPQIEQLLQGDRNCLVVVGALHLVGKGGLLELLHQDGYRPQQLN
jgi:uncharacterized protein YbaP (TraB family)